jgi:hypothetical protein
MTQNSKIDLMIIGAQKAGTTSLKNYLNEHPAILGHPQTEFTWFAAQSEESFSEAFGKQFTEGDADKAKAVVAKNVALYYDEAAIKKLKDHNPACKLVFVVREPVERAYSSYTMEVSNGWLKRDFKELKNEVIKCNTHDGLYRILYNLGLYGKHLKMILNHFPKDQIKVYRFEQLKQQPESICKDLFEWLGIDPSFEPDTGKVYNKTQKVKSGLLASILIWLRHPNNPIKRFVKWILPYHAFTKLGNRMIDFNKTKARFEPMSEEMEAFLRDSYRPSVTELEELTGLDLSDWK